MLKDCKEDKVNPLMKSVENTTVNYNNENSLRHGHRNRITTKTQAEIKLKMKKIRY